MGECVTAEAKHSWGGGAVEGYGRIHTFMAAVSESLGMLPPWNFDS